MLSRLTFPPESITPIFLEFRSELLLMSAAKATADEGSMIIFKRDQINLSADKI